MDHVALEVGDVEESLAFDGLFFEAMMRGSSHGAAFIDIGDQFIALWKDARDRRSRAPLRARRR